MTTITDICSGKADYDECAAEMLYKIANALGVIVDFMLENNTTEKWILRRHAMRLKNVLLVVSDITQSKRFYHELFGLQIVRDFGENVILSEGLVLQEQTSWEQLRLNIEDDQSMLIESRRDSIRKAYTVVGNASEIFFEENNLDAFLLSAKEYGVEFVGDVRVNSWDKRVAMLKDPDGHLIEVAEA